MGANVENIRRTVFVSFSCDLVCIVIEVSQLPDAVHGHEILTATGSWGIPSPSPPIILASP
jgi:hypothetical protein